MKLGEISGHKHMLGRTAGPIIAPFVVVGWTLAARAWIPWPVHKNIADIWMASIFLPPVTVALCVAACFGVKYLAQTWVLFVRKGVEIDREIRTQFKLRESRKAEAGGLSEIEPSEAGAMSLAAKEPHNG